MVHLSSLFLNQEHFVPDFKTLNNKEYAMDFFWVALGGAIGATSRYALSLWLLKPHAVFPWSTWTINLVGCLLAGVFFALSQRYSILQQQPRLFFMVGILGGFTTFSSFGLETFQLLKQGHLNVALSYVLSSVLFGLVLLVAAFVLTELLLNNR